MALNESQLKFLKKIETASEEKRMYLRKALGGTLNTGTFAWQAFVSTNPPYYSEEERQIYYFVACVKASQKKGDKISVTEGLCKAWVLRKHSDSFEKKFLSLTKCTPDAFGNFERKVLSLLPKEVLVQINAEELLDDLLQWSHSKRFVQEKWGEALYCPNVTDNFE